MLRRSLGRWGALLLEQQPAVVLQGGSNGAVTRGIYGGANIWAKAASHSSKAAGFTRKAEPTSTMASRIRLLKAEAPFANGQPRRTFHSSRRAQDKAKGEPQEKAREKSQDEAKSKAKSEKSGASSEAEPQSLSARMKKLSREYGWTAVGVYFGLSLLDFPFCFLLVRTLGTDKIATAEHYVVSHVQAIVPESAKDWWHNYRSELKKTKVESGNATGSEEDAVGWGVEEADAQLKKEASLATQLALAYAIHKSFIFIRVPLAAAVTPRVVKVLRSWGWKIGKQKPA